MINSHSGNETASNPVILYYGGGWPTNIGNAFIDIGAVALLRAAVPNAKIHIASEMPRWLFAAWRRPRRLARLRDRFFSNLTPGVQNALDIAELTKCDLVAFSGMAMCEEFVRVNGPAIRGLRERGVPVLLLGTGGEQYTAEERSLYGAFLQQIRPVALISRDQSSYETYGEYVEKSFSGIDCGFFVALGYEPARLVLPPFVIVNFDSTPEPVLAANRLDVIRTSHQCWGPVSRALASQARTMVSDLPHDYLTLYSQAECVYSDRVHACVAALSYGRKAQLFHPTRRGDLFEAAGAGSIRAMPVSLDLAELDAKRKLQIRIVADIVARALGLPARPVNEAHV